MSLGVVVGGANTEIIQIPQWLPPYLVRSPQLFRPRLGFAPVCRNCHVQKPERNSCRSRWVGEGK